MSDTATRAPAPAPLPAKDGRSPMPLTGLIRWETALVGLLVATLVWASSESATFLNTTTFFYIGLNMGEIAIMALPLMLIVMTGEIDLSVASMLGLSGSVLGYLFQSGWSIYPAIVAALLVGAAGGALNGFLVTRLSLPSIAVTIGTLTLFRGLAEVILGTSTVGGYPLSLVKVGVEPIPHTHLSYSIGIFIVLAVVCGVVLHLTPLGRSIVAVGLQSETAHFSGIRVNRIKFGLYVLSGVVSAFAGILFTLKNSSARYDAGTGLELTVVAIVLFGGVSIFGGRGTVLGVVLAVAIVGCVNQSLTQLNEDPQVQKIVAGVLLLVSVILPNSRVALQRIRARTRRRTG